MENKTCIITIEFLGCIDKTDLMILLGAAAVAFIVLVVIPLWVSSSKADKTADRIERNRKHRENPTGK